MLKWILPLLLFASVSDAKSNAIKKTTQPSTQQEKTIHSKYLVFCAQRVQQKHSLNKARAICQCALKHIKTIASLEEIKLLSLKSPQRLTERNEEEKKRNEQLIALSDLEVHSLDDCERSVLSSAQ